MAKMEKGVLEKYGKAKSISDSVVKTAKPLVVEGAKAIDVAEKIESRIKKLGGGIAFPVNLSVNEDAAHYTPDIGDALALKAGDLVKIDVGVHVDGYIWDRAFTLCVGSKTHPLIEAAEDGLKAAIKLIKPGVKIFEVSEAVESTLEGHGFNPIRNLCGHGLDQYNQHARFSIPNGRNSIQTELEVGQAVAMEVFATDGGGWVKESSPTLIFQFASNKAVRMQEARRILEAARDDFNKLPFAKRWLPALKGTEMSEFKIDMALRQLADVDALREYPILKEENNGLVAQAEETVLI
jgi:methionyl aminopeptidase